MSEFSLEGALTLFYYDDLERAFNFYNDVIGFDFVADFGYVKLFKVIEGALLGLVDGQLGSHRTSPSKETFEDEPFTGKKMKLKGFTFQDTEGYTVEMCQYLTPYGL